MKTHLILSVLIGVAVLLSGTEAAARSENAGGGRDRSDMFSRRINSQEIKALKNSKNPTVNMDVYGKVMGDLQRNGLNANSSGIRTMMAFLARSPSASCSYGAREKGMKMTLHSFTNGGLASHGAVCETGGKKMFFGGVSKPALRSMEFRGVKNIVHPAPTEADAVNAAADAYMAESGAQIPNAQPPGVAFQPTLPVAYPAPTVSASSQTVTSTDFAPDAMRSPASISPASIAPASVWPAGASN